MFHFADITQIKNSTIEMAALSMQQKWTSYKITNIDLSLPIYTYIYNFLHLKQQIKSKNAIRLH